ncbi:MAG TPA: YhcH/YjgK/YiaL family protein [Chryseosolibacter sp.]
MILDDIRYSSRYEFLGPLFKKAFQFIAANDMTLLPPGKHEIQGDDLFVIIMEYETKEPVYWVMENHRKYIDIQYMLRGEELMGVQTFANQTPTTAYDESRDAAFYKPEYDSLLKVKQGQFAIFFPHDLHMPSMQSGAIQKVLKAVFKVKVTE